MTQAREIMDKVTAAALAGDRSALRALYADDAVLESPEGRLVGPDAIAEYLAGFTQAFPDLSYEFVGTHDAGDIAIDEGFVSGTNTGPLATPDGEVPATGRSIRVRECDVLTARDGLAIAHRFYYDQLDFLTQLGLAGQQTIVLPEQETRAQTGVGATG